MKPRLLILPAIALIAGLVWFGTALADPVHDPAVTITPEAAGPGDEVIIKGSGFGPDAEISITTDELSEPLATMHTDAHGDFEAHIVLPHEMPEGMHQLMVMDSGGTAATVQLAVAGAIETIDGGHVEGAEDVHAEPVGVVEDAHEEGMEDTHAADAAPAAISDAEFDQAFIDRIPSSYESAEIFVEGTIGAALPVVLLLILALHLARPYMLNVLQKFSLRLGADIWWMVYLGARDLLVVVGFLLSGIFLLPHVLEMTELPIVGSVTAAILFLALTIKLTRDVDEDRVALLVVTNLLALAAALYIGTYVLGVMGQDIITGGPMNEISDALVTTSNLDTARYLLYGSLATIVASGLYAVYFNLSIAVRRTPKAAGSR